MFKSCLCLLTSFFVCINAFSQIDTLHIHNPVASFGPLDLRISKSPTNYYYLQEDVTFSFRENNGVKTNSYLDMTAWDSHPYRQGNMREKTEAGDLFTMNYRLLIPQAYDASYSKGYPLVILLHGSLERGNCSDGRCYHASNSYSPNVNIPPAPTSASHELLNNDYNLVHGGSNYLEAHELSGTSLPDDHALPAKAFPGFVVFPQNLNGWNESSAEDAIRLVRLLVKKYNIDENRIYINGVSNGGRGAYEVMKRAPWLFAAGILFSAADDASIISQKLISNIATIPLWIFQGGVDQKPTQKQTEGYIKQFRNAGVNVRYTLYPQLGHGTWNKAFAEPDFFSWMLRQKKNNIHLVGASAMICATTGEGARLALPDGYATYQWEFNGGIVENANKSFLVATQVGAYRGRFSNRAGQFSDWSEVINVTEKSPPPALIEQVGTVLLKDPNGKNEAVLKAEVDLPNYYWYKNGSLIDFPGDQDDTVKLAIIKQGLGDGAYHLEASDFDRCKTVPSNSKTIIFSNRAPLNIPAPTEFEAENTSPSEVSLSWKDLSQDEIGFEIWRRFKLDSDKYSNWQMAILTSSNVVSFVDKNLLPSSTYQYIIRAVSVSRRSPYSPSESSPLEVQTMSDNELPSPPLDLEASIVGINAVGLRWKPSSDNSAIHGYKIYYNGDTVSTGPNDTTHILKDLEVNTLYKISLRAVDVASNISQTSNEVQINTSVDGLFYQHATGAWDNLESIDWSIAEFTGIVDDFTLSPKTQEDFFNFRFDGYLHIEKDGVYQFRISSDDGSRLSLDDSLWIQNDGVHNLVTITAPIHLMTAGPHRITVDFFDYVKGDTLLVEYKGPDSNNEWVKVPAEVLRSNVITSIEPEANGSPMSVYPNPARYQINILFEKPNSELVFVYMFDNLGKLHFQSEGLLDEGRFTIDLSEKLPPGMYLLKVKSVEGLSTKKILIKD